MEQETASISPRLSPMVSPPSTDSGTGRSKQKQADVLDNLTPARTVPFSANLLKWLVFFKGSTSFLESPILDMVSHPSNSSDGVQSIFTKRASSWGSSAGPGKACLWLLHHGFSGRPSGLFELALALQFIYYV